MYKRQVPASTDFSQARSVGVEYVEVAFNQCYRGVPADEVVPRIRDMKANADGYDLLYRMTQAGV